MIAIFIFSPILCGAFGYAGWFLYCNPVRVLDFVFGKGSGQPRPIRFFKAFGLIMMGIAGLEAAMTVVFALLRAFA